MNVAVCLACGTILHSKHRHDYVVCQCPNKAMLDGGDDYCRAGAVNPALHQGCKTMAEAKRRSSEVLTINYAVRDVATTTTAKVKVTRRDTSTKTNKKAVN